MAEESSNPNPNPNLTTGHAAGSSGPNSTKIAGKLELLSRLDCLKPSSPSAFPTHLGLFAYGTLTIDAVMHALLGRVPPSTTTTAPGWRAAGLPDLPYPGLIADPTSNAPGRVYNDLTEREWAILDAFENPKYDIARIELANNASEALAYVWPAEPPALTTTWTVDCIDTERMEDYIAMCVEFRQEWEESQRLKSS
ncbi:hypothetical protein B0T21DRAFT_410949 [Apiosordaria backusii]|uniref:Putative gamma-glutamylcyclotransferase n=1 Tax=Apiosordaria backusii TaxID=314023 RepID=A0AA40BNI0_9PEZI|nr:hypothetical protein B0T21DRAFT_410949 [Apiosordaria backusii]